MIYQKSYVPPNTVGFKQGNLGSVFRVGYKAAGQVLSLGNKAKQFYEKYGAHVPQVAEKVRELEPYLNKAMDDGDFIHLVRLHCVVWGHQTCGVRTPC